MGEGRVSWDEMNSEAIKQGRFIKAYPMVHEVLAPNPSVISDLACATMVAEDLSECNIRNNLNLKTILGSKVGQFYAKDTENIDEEEHDLIIEAIEEADPERRSFGKLSEDEKIYNNEVEIGKVLINEDYPFALIKFLDKNFDREQIFKGENGKFKILVPEWLKI